LPVCNLSRSHLSGCGAPAPFRVSVHSRSCINRSPSHIAFVYQPTKTPPAMGWNRHSKQADLREALDGFDSLYLSSDNGIKKGSGAPEIQEIESVLVTTDPITPQSKAKIAPKDRPKGRLYHKPRPSQADLDEAAGGRDPVLVDIYSPYMLVRLKDLLTWPHTQ
jgi:hypothetical protein